MTTPVLLIVDVQDAIDDPVWGRRGQPDMETRIAAMLVAWRGKRLPIVHVRHDSTDPSSPYRPGQAGNHFKRQVAPETGEPVVDKRANSAFIGTDLMDVLEELQASQLVVTGVLLENSVDATVRMAHGLGFDVVIAADAVASIDRTDHNGKLWPAEDVHALSLAVLGQDYATITDSKSIIEALP